MSSSNGRSDWIDKAFGVLMVVLVLLVVVSILNLFGVISDEPAPCKHAESIGSEV